MMYFMVLNEGGACIGEGAFIRGSISKCETHKKFVMAKGLTIFLSNIVLISNSNLHDHTLLN